MPSILGREGPGSCFTTTGLLSIRFKTRQQPSHAQSWFHVLQAAATTHRRSGLVAQCALDPTPLDMSPGRMLAITKYIVRSDTESPSDLIRHFKQMTAGTEEQMDLGKRLREILSELPGEEEEPDTEKYAKLGDWFAESPYDIDRALSHIVIDTNWEFTAYALIMAGADPYARNASGNNVLECAEFGTAAMLEMLLKATDDRACPQKVTTHLECHSTTLMIMRWNLTDVFV